MNIVDKTVSDVKALKIQGATNVRKKSIEALVKASLNSKTKTEKDFRKEFLINAKKLFNARPTEPELRTALRIIKKNISDKNLTINQMKKIIDQTSSEYEKERSIAMKKMAGYGAKLIKKNSVILTLCHSSTVVNTLIAAKQKIDHVYCCETRPKYQGRITAKKLADAGIKVTLIIDNAAATVMKKCDYFFTGADAFLASGSIVNKIGTNQLSHLCENYSTKHYVVLSTHKFEPSSFFGIDSPIEDRDPKEVLEKKIRGVEVINPAFDVVDARLIKGIICEKGIFPPQVLASKLYAELKLDKYEKNFLVL